jgi:hypothetical protein
MKAMKILTLAGAVALAAALSVSPANAGAYARQYYGGWQHGNQGYWYCNHYYKPYADYPTYLYNYCIYYPATPKFVYYYNPYKGTYWGRFDRLTKSYSLLAEKDRAGRLKDVPEKAFPAEGPLPAVPDTKDKVQLAEPPDLPAGEKIGSDAAAADPAADVTAPTELPVDQGKDNPAKDNPAPTPAAGQADKTPPTDTPVDPPVDTPPTGSGVQAPPEPVTPPVTTPASTPASTPAPVPAPVDDGVTGGGNKVDPVVPPCHRRYGGCHSNYPPPG